MGPDGEEHTTGFNPTLVRLAPLLRLFLLRGVQRFNPTLVRLAPPQAVELDARKNSFNPTLVRLALGAATIRVRLPSVSIPPWFD